ncbi:MAG: GNAT family N-acetyltransferase [Actinomycetota bacterium]|nr:MAG: GNAT family N-acetyltransferase [Actinomycetota bacterium]
MATDRFTIKPLDPTTWDAFAALVEANGGIFGGCWCMGMHPDDRTHLDAAQPHREQKHDRVRAGTAHAALVFDGDACVGWCQFGSPAEVVRIKNRKEYEKELDELPAWRIGCCYVGKGHRRQGVAAAALAGALELIAELGGGRVEGYPEPAADVPAGFLYHGVLSSFEQAGFRKDRKIGKHRWVVSTQVTPKLK